MVGRLNYVSQANKEEEAHTFRYISHSNKEKEARRVRCISQPDKKMEARRVRYLPPNLIRKRVELLIKGKGGAESEICVSL